MWIEVIMLIVLLAFCVISSTEDIKDGIVKNKLIFIFAIDALFLQFFDLFFFAPDRTQLLAVNLIITFCAALLLYSTGIWAGGDAKFTMCAASLYPTGFYLRFDTARYNLVSFVIIAFAVGFVYLIGETFVRIKNDQQETQLLTKKDILTFIKGYATMLTYAYFISELITFVGMISGLSLAWLTLPLVLAMAFFIGKFPILNIPFLIIAVIAADIILSFVTGNINLSSDVMSYVFLFLFAMLRIAVSKYNYVTIKTSDVKKGMVLSVSSIFAFRNSRVKNLPLYTTEDLKSRLSEEEAEAVRRWEKSKYGKEEIIVVRKLPFIVFIFLGILIYFIGSCVLN